jgi:hypothetical protein
VGTGAVNALVVLMERQRLNPGESGLVQLRLLEHLDSIGLTHRVGDERFLQTGHSSRFCPLREPSHEARSNESLPEALDRCS